MAPQDFEAEQAAWSKQYDTQQAAQKTQEQQAKEPPSFLSRWMAPVGRATLSLIDSTLGSLSGSELDPTTGMRDLASGAAQGAANIVDAANPAKIINAGEEQLLGKGNVPVKFEMPIWDHAQRAIMDFRDAAAVKDPTLADNIVQGGAQLAIPFAAYSRTLAGIHGFSNMAVSGMLTDATALGPHDPRTADMITLGRHTEGKLGEVLRTLAPNGSALNDYITYLADRSNETEAEGRFKNALDGYGVNLIVSPLLSAVATTLKQGTAGLRYMAANGVGSASELAPNLAAQRGAVGDLSQVRPPLRQNYDPAENILEEQVRRDVDAAHANPNGQRPPLVQGGDPAAPLYDAQARADAEAAAAKVGGKIVYHGTPYDFDEFRSTQIGTGEGNQTFGHGFYFAENPKTAGHYQNMIVPQNGALGAAMTEAQKAVKAAGGRAQAYSQLSQQFAREKDPLVRQQLQQQMSLIRSGNYARGQGTLVHAEISNEHLDSMMHWDQPIAKQPQLQKVISNLDVKIVPEGDKFRVTLNGKPGGLFMDQDAAKAATFHLRGAGRSGEFNGGALYDDLTTVLGSQQAASEFLSRRGIHGIKFLDQGSRDAGEGTHNIVLFNDKHAKVVKKERAGA